MSSLRLDLNIFLALFQRHDKELLNFLSLQEDSLGKKLHFLKIEPHLLLPSVELIDIRFQGLIVFGSSVADLGDCLLPLAHFLSNKTFEVFQLIFVGLDFGLLERSHCLILLQLLLIQSQVDL